MAITVGELSLEPGKYFKVGSRRIGKAHLIVAEDGALTYVDSRGEVEAPNEKQFLQKYKTGLDVRICGPDETPEHMQEGTKPKTASKKAKDVSDSSEPLHLQTAPSPAPVATKEPVEVTAPVKPEPVEVTAPISDEPTAHEEPTAEAELLDLSEFLGIPTEANILF